MHIHTPTKALTSMQGATTGADSSSSDDNSDVETPVRATEQLDDHSVPGPHPPLPRSAQPITNSSSPRMPAVATAELIDVGASSPHTVVTTPAQTVGIDPLLPVRVSAIDKSGAGLGWPPPPRERASSFSHSVDSFAPQRPDGISPHLWRPRLDVYAADTWSRARAKSLSPAAGRSSASSSTLERSLDTFLAAIDSRGDSDPPVIRLRSLSPTSAQQRAAPATAHAAAHQWRPPDTGIWPGEGTEDGAASVHRSRSLPPIPPPSLDNTHWHTRRPSPAAPLAHQRDTRAPTLGVGGAVKTLSSLTQAISPPRPARLHTRSKSADPERVPPPSPPRRRDDATASRSRISATAQLEEHASTEAADSQESSAPGPGTPDAQPPHQDRAHAVSPPPKPARLRAVSDPHTRSRDHSRGRARVGDENAILYVHEQRRSKTTVARYVLVRAG